MADNNQATDQATSTATTVDAVKAAEERAAAAEKRAATLEAEEQKRVAEAKRAAEAKEIKDLDSAKEAAAAAEKRAAAAEARAEAFEKKEAEQIEGRYKTLPDDVQREIEPLRDSMSRDAWSKLVDREIARIADTDNPGTPDKQEIPPTHATPPRRSHVQSGRQLMPAAEEILSGMLGVDTDPAKQMLIVERDKGSGEPRGRFIFPAGKLKRYMKERAIQPRVLTKDARDAMLRRK